MSIWKLRVGAESYYLAQVANGLEDYYTGRGETAGRWLGTAATGLGLEAGGEVAGGDLRAVFAGLRPGTGESPNGGRPVVFKDRVPGFDLTFAAPKSVSVLYALGDPLVQSTVVAAHDAAVAEAVAWLEREACHVRRGSNNRTAATGASGEFGTRRLRGGGFVAAAFRHRTSRAADPHLHTHVLVANTTLGPDGRWSALDATGLYRAKHTAGAVFRTALAAQLTDRLGVGWRPAGKGLIEIAGIPSNVLHVFSKRREEIEAHMAAHGVQGAAAAADAMLATRTTKAVVDPTGLREMWRAEAAAVGFGDDQLDTLLTNITDVPNRQDLLVSIPDPVTGELVERQIRSTEFAAWVGARMVDVDSACTRFQITEIIAELLPGIGTNRLEQTTAWVLAQPELIPLPHPTRPSGAPLVGWEQRWTSHRLLTIETELLDALDTDLPAPPVASAELIGDVIGASTLGADQADAVRLLCTSTRQVDVLVGRAGTGKTYTLATIRQILQGSCGQRLIGVAPSARAARELADGAGIDAYTFPRFRLHAAPTLGANDVVIIDEAGMAGTVDLHHVITHAANVGARVILVGDHHQLPEIGAGGTFAAAVDLADNEIAELTVNRRQQEVWEHDALDQLRHGNALAGFRTYLEHDRVTIAPTPTDIHERAVNDWAQAHRTGVDTILLAGTRAEARTLNRLARTAVTNELSGPALEVRDRVFQAGDHVVLLRNASDRDGHIDVGTGVGSRLDNGMVGTIEHIDDDASLTIQLTNGRRLRVDGGYVRAGHVDHGYATTIHKAQGLTCDQMFLVGPAGLYREAVYVAMSRARNGSHLYATTTQIAELVERPHTRGIPLPDEHDDEPDHDLQHALTNSRAKTLAINLDPALPDIAQLATTRSLDELWARHANVRNITTHLAAGGLENPDNAQARLDTARAHRRFLTAGVRVNAADWDNVGTVIAVIDTTGLAYVEFTSTTGRRTRRMLQWADTRPIDHPEPVDITPDATDYFHLAQQAVDQTRHEWDTALHQHGIRPDETHTLPAAIAMRRQRCAHTLVGRPPRWLTTWLGQRPTDPVGAQVWDDEVEHLAAWRDAHHLPPTVAGYGPQPKSPNHVPRWLEHLDRSLNTRTWLHNHQPSLPPPAPADIDITAIRARLDELDQLLASAPPDQRIIIDAIRNGNLTPTDIHAALTQAAAAQQTRRQWILEHWPHVVEHAELTALSDQHDPLAHWPTATSPEVEDLWYQLLAISTDTPETATITELDARIAEHHPTAILHRLETERHHLANQRDQLAGLAATETDPSAADAYRHHTDRLDQRIRDIDHEIDGHAARVAFWEWNQRPDHLTEATHRRGNHLAHTAILRREPWLLNMLTDWHNRAQRGSTSDLRSLVADVATYRERFGVHGPTPLGRPTNHPEQKRLNNALHPPSAPPSISDLLTR